MAELKEMYTIVDHDKDLKYEESTRLNDPEQRLYLVCICGNSDADEWCICKGRPETYEYIKERLDIINFEESFVLVETLKLKDRISIYTFMKKVQSNYQDNFDIDEFIKGDWDESDYRSNNGIDDRLLVDNNSKFSMEQLMDGNIETTSLE